MLKTIIITILFYSFINTIFCIYKDWSDYSDGLAFQDIIMGGPVTWILLVVFHILNTIINSNFYQAKIKKGKKKKIYSKKQIKKIVKKIIKNAKKNEYKKNRYYDFSTYMCWDDDQCSGYETLLITKFPYEHLNKSFKYLMYNQKEETIDILKNYCELVTEDIMKADNCSRYYIEEHKNKECYRLK